MGWGASLYLRESVAGDGMKEFGLIPHDQPWPAVIEFVASLSQIPPIVPVLPTQPTRKYCSVYNLQFDYGMEEVVGSIPTRSTNISLLFRLRFG